MTHRLGPVRQRMVNGWLALLFWLVAHVPWIAGALKPFIVRITWAASSHIRRVTDANARHLLGPTSSPGARRALGRAVLNNCIEAVIEFGRNRTLSPAQILSSLESVSGREQYVQARQRGRGAILVTAHLGSFETAMAMLKQYEPRVHVVFRRDRFSLFERLRAQQHARLGVLDAPVNDGLQVWFALREALRADEVVLMQGDRVLDGQPGVEVPFMGGRMRVPSGPVKLARLTNSPLIPTFCIRTNKNQIRIALEAPIWPDERPMRGERIDPALLQLISVIERYVRAFPDQWLCLHPAWCDDILSEPSARRAEVPS